MAIAGDTTAMRAVADGSVAVRGAFVCKVT
jgi:hypothetical protein